MWKFSFSEVEYLAMAAADVNACYAGWGKIYHTAFEQDMLLGCPRKLGLMVSNWVITPIHPIYK